MSEPKWTHFAEVRFAGGKMHVRTKNGGYWVQTKIGEEVPRDEIILHPRRRHDDE